MVGGELAQEEGDADGEEDEEEACRVHDLGLRVLRHVLQEFNTLVFYRLRF